ncbi:MAG: hypothetical protein IIA53_07690 [Chloroflexi bacterium]|nr:hypothetical protein [Chloroflexota bacterium]
MNTHELVVFDELEELGFSVFYPRRDRGIDCLVTTKKPGDKYVPIQIKGSKKYGTGGGWFVFNIRKLEQQPDQIWIFVWPDLNQKQEFEAFFIVIEASELLERIRAVSTIGKSGRIDLYFEAKGDRVLQTRGLKKTSTPEQERDFTSFVGNWKLIAKRLS